VYWGQDLQELMISSISKHVIINQKRRGDYSMEETLKLILAELKDLKKGQKELKEDVSSIKNNLINGLGPYFERVEKLIDHKTDSLKGTLEDQLLVIDTLAARSIKHESEIKDFKRLLKNQ
jgi:hypothetical protein